VVPPGDTPHMSKMIDLTMLGMLAGRERPEEDWRELLTSAGFTGITMIPTGTPLSVIHATVAPEPVSMIVGRFGQIRSTLAHDHGAP
jgi:hypothetical protein